MTRKGAPRGHGAARNRSHPLPVPTVGAAREEAMTDNEPTIEAMIAESHTPAAMAHRLRMIANNPREFTPAQRKAFLLSTADRLEAMPSGADRRNQYLDLRDVPRDIETNEDRAAMVRPFMEAFGRAYSGGSSEPDETVLSDMIGDLLHLADRIEDEEGGPCTADYILERARYHYDAEVDEAAADELEAGR
jgi:hypothetical protein